MLVVLPAWVVLCWCDISVSGCFAWSVLLFVGLGDMFGCLVNSVGMVSCYLIFIWVFVFVEFWVDVSCCYDALFSCVSLLDG